MGEQLHEFDAAILEGRGGGAFVEIPFSVPDVMGARGRVPVQATFDGHAYRGSIAPMGGRHILGVRKDVRASISKDVGDVVHVALRRDTAPRTVDVPPELAAELRGSPEASARFEQLSFTHRKEYAQWIAEAKRAETRERRAREAVRRLLEATS